MTPRADSIASIVINEFNKLPSKRKPAVRDNGLHEWVPLSGIVAEIEGDFICLALATGMKCLPASKLAQSKGVAIHDWHAEILAIRTFNRYLLDECHKIAVQGASSVIIEPRSFVSSNKDDLATPFQIKKDVKLHMYCSEAPCGDASMELTMADQPNAVPWEVPTAEVKPGTPATPDDGEYLPGRAYFSRLGVVRRKPARGDAEPTFSKSCSDKLALKQCTSLLGALTSLYVDVSGAYIDTLVISRPRYSETGCDRAFGAHGRMAPVKGAQWPRGYSFKPFKVETTDEEFFFSKNSVLQRSDKIAASNLATLWSHSGLVETILAGVIRGRRPFDIRGASCVSRLQIWATAEALARHLAGDDVDEVELVKYATYKQVKEGQFLAARRQVKAETRSTALAGWITDDRDSEFAIPV